MARTNELPELRTLPFQTDEGCGARARIGMILLETDRTLEVEARQIAIEGVDFYHSRIAMVPEVTADTLTAMKRDLPVAASLLPNEFEFAAIGYGCTSAATLIGEDGVAAAIQSAHPDVPCTNPITAATAAFAALGTKRIAVVTPYSAAVTEPIGAHFASAGLDVVALGSFLETNDLVVSRITEAAIADGVRAMHTLAVDDGGCDAVFVSCTSLRAFGVVDELERELGVPIVSSNLAFLWHLLRLAGINDAVDGLGALFQT